MIILYTGLGCKGDFNHTETEFLEIMNKEFTWKDWKNESKVPISCCSQLDCTANTFENSNGCMQWSDSMTLPFKIGF